MARHRWSGWPGAVCLKCFQEDVFEIALADNVFDPDTGWRDEATKQQYLQTWPVE